MVCILIKLSTISLRQRRATAVPNKTNRIKFDSALARQQLNLVSKRCAAANYKVRIHQNTFKTLPDRFFIFVFCFWQQPFYSTELNSMSETKTCQCRAVVELQSSQLSTAVARRLKQYTCIFFREHFLYNALKTFPVTQFRSRERRKLHFRESNFTNFPGGGGACPLDQLNHCIRYFQVLPKTLQAICQFLFFL